MPDEITVSINLKDKLDKIQDYLELVREELLKHSLEDEKRFQEIRSEFVKKEELEKYYTKGEMDKAIKSIEEYTASVKELLTTHLNFVNKTIEDVKKEHDTLRSETTSSKDKNNGVLISILVGLVMFILGAGLNFIIQLIK